jgi:thiol-disulfide isomerase/thioredoxin
MKKELIILFILGQLISCIGPNTKTDFKGTLLPSYDLLLLDSSSRLNTGTISEGKPIIIFYFSTNCPFCRKQTQEIINEIYTLSDVEFYFISIESLSVLKNYAINYKLLRFKNITVAQDYHFEFAKYFNLNSIPFTAIYNRDKRLKQAFTGRAKIQAIKQIIYN